jgi:hypothetical protein
MKLIDDAVFSTLTDNTGIDNNNIRLRNSGDSLIAGFLE